MLLMILELILTVAAWRKGWRGWSLLPVAIILFMGFTVGIILGGMGFSESQVQQIVPGLLPLEVSGIGVLIWMSSKGRKRVVVEHKEHIPENSTVAAKAV